MSRGARGWLLIALSLPAPLAGQLGELQAGLVAAYGTGRPYGPGAGVTIGVATGRIAYVGARWIYHMGTTRSVDSVPAMEIRNRTQLFTVDLGLQLPAGAVEILPGVSFGAARFSQRSRQPAPGGGTTEVLRARTRFLAAPGVAVEIYAGRLAVIPQLQYALAGNPEFPSPVQHHGMVASVRLVVTQEIGRIRR